MIKNSKIHKGPAIPDPWTRAYEEGILEELQQQNFGPITMTGLSKADRIKRRERLKAIISHDDEGILPEQPSSN